MSNVKLKVQVNKQTGEIVHMFAGPLYSARVSFIKNDTGAYVMRALHSTVEVNHVLTPYEGQAAYAHACSVEAAIKHASRTL